MAGEMRNCKLVQAVDPVCDPACNWESLSEFGILSPFADSFRDKNMASSLSIFYFANHEMLGMASEQEYEQFKELLLEALQAEWPDAVIRVNDDEESYFETNGISGQAELDVRTRINDIVKDVIDTGDWRDEEEEFYEDEDSEALGNLEEKDDY